MEIPISPYLYETNLLIAYSIPLLLFAFLFSPKHLTALVVMIVFLRPNERFDLPLSLPTLMFPLLFLSLIIHNEKFIAYKFRKQDKILLILISFIMFETILFHRGDIKNHLMGFAGLKLIYYLSILINLSDIKGIKLFSYAILISCFLICFEPLYYRLTHETDSELYQIFNGTGRLQAWGVWENANETSYLACFGIASMLMIFLKEKKITSLFVFIPLLFMFIIVIFFTGSRTGLGCLVLIFFVFNFLSKSKMLKIFTILLLLIAIIILPKLLPERTDKESSSRERFDLRYEGKMIFRHNPIFGVGYGRAKEETGGMMLHCTYIQAFAETGLFGGSLVIYMMFIIGRKIYTGLRTNKHNKMINQLYAGIGGVFLSGLLYTYFGNQFLTTIFYTLIGFVNNYINVINALENQTEKIVVT